MGKKRILIIDDEERIRENYCRIFKAAGETLFEVYQSKNALEATEVLAHNDIDLVLLDLRLPGVDGGRFFKALNASYPDLMVIVASVFSLDLQKKMVPNANDYYDKAQGPFGLLDKVTNMLS